jgi:hypothetical protein
MSYLIDDNGGIQRFPKGPGIYAIVFRPDHEDRLYVGATKSIRLRLGTHLKTSHYPAWVRRLARELLHEELLLDPGQRPDSHPEFFDFCHYARLNCDAKVLQVLPFNVSPTEIATAEDHWIAKLKPQLNAPRRAVGGYKTL